MSEHHQYLCIYGHFYQPPREDPFTGQVPSEFGAAPHSNFNEKITAECYEPNARLGNFGRMSFDLGPTLASWMAEQRPEVLASIAAADTTSVCERGTGAALAQAYNHTILPLATERDKRTQIVWGQHDFSHRFGRPAEGMWLPETAADLETLAALKACGVRYTVLAPWQAAEPVDVTEPYLVRLPSGDTMTVFFYNGTLSGGVSFQSEATVNADHFASNILPPHLNQEKRTHGEDQLIIIATDGELYGHHKAWRDYFLDHLTRVAAPNAGFTVTSLDGYLRDHPAKREVRLHAPAAWSCAHGVARWSDGCGCTEGDAAWKGPLRTAFDHLGRRLDHLYERETSKVFVDPWAARDDYVALRLGSLTADEYWERHERRGWRPGRAQRLERTRRLLEAQYFGQWMYTSCGFFFEDLDRIEPRNDIAFARRAISLAWQATGHDLQTTFLRDLAHSKSWRTGVTGADLYRGLPRQAEQALPSPSSKTSKRAASREPAA